MHSSGSCRDDRTCGADSLADELGYWGLREKQLTLTNLDTFLSGEQTILAILLSTRDINFSNFVKIWNPMTPFVEFLSSVSILSSSLETPHSWGWCNFMTRFFFAEAAWNGLYKTKRLYIWPLPNPWRLILQRFASRCWLGWTPWEWNSSIFFRVFTLL